MIPSSATDSGIHTSPSPLCDSQVVDRNKPPQQPGKRIDEQLQFIMSITMGDWELMKAAVSDGSTKVGRTRVKLTLSMDICLDSYLM